MQLCSLHAVLLTLSFLSQAPADTPFPAHRVIGNVYYVGSKALASYLITTPQGHILINSGFEETVPLIRASVESLGFRMRDVKILLESHAHSDHVAGLALLQELTGAKVYVMRGDDTVISDGGVGQYLYTTSRWKPCAVDRVLNDGDKVELGDVTLVARLTPGHTRGCTTWTWRATEGKTTYDVVVIGSPNVNPGYALVQNNDYAEIADDFAKTFKILRSLPCDIFLGAHGEYYGMIAKHERAKGADRNPFIDPLGYRDYVELKEKAFRKTLAEQTASFADKPDTGMDAYDLLIRNGRIIDGTGNPWFYGDLAIRGDRIAALDRALPGNARREIDAKGLVVAPGFIDMHSHSDYLLLEDGNAQSKVRQGVTTEVLGEGGSAGPYKRKRESGAETDDAKSTRWATLGGYFDAVERSGVAVNVVSYVGLDTVWQGVMGNSFDRPSADQIEQMKTLVDEAMADGAFGLSSQLAMPPGSLATTDDIVELCRVVARHHGIFSSHIRNEGTGVFDAVKEAISVGERAGIPVDVIHIKIADQKYWGRMNEVIGLIEAARKRGVNVQANIYPYTRGNNNLSSIIPPWAHEGGTARMIERLKDRAERERMKKDIREGIPGWYNHYTAVGGDWARMLVNGRGTYEGLTMDRVIAIRSKGKDPAPDPLDILFDVLIDECGSVPTVYAHHTDSDMHLALSQPWCSIGSDGLAYAVEGPLRRGVPHPRSFGTFPRVLGVYVREVGLLRLEDAVRKMTSLNASKLGIPDRGLLRVGNHADVVVFDPAQIIDRATYEDPFQYSEGVVYLMVNGKLVLDRGEHTGQRPGRAIRHGLTRMYANKIKNE